MHLLSSALLTHSFNVRYVVFNFLLINTYLFVLRCVLPIGNLDCKLILLMRKMHAMLVFIMLLEVIQVVQFSDHIF